MSMRQDRAVTLVEVLLALTIFTILGMLLLSLSRFSHTAVNVTGWKQTAHDSLKKNVVFWSKYLTAATYRVDQIQTDATGVIQGTPTITSVPLKIRGGGAGNLMKDFPGTAAEWPLWQFQIHEKTADATVKYTSKDVLCYLKGAPPSPSPHRRISPQRNSPPLR